MPRFGRALATLVVLAGSAFMAAYSLATGSSSPLFALLTAAALLPVAYVVDTVPRPQPEEPLLGEAAMLVVALVALAAGSVAFASQSSPATVVAGLAAVIAVGLVGRNWWQRTTPQRR